MSVRQYDHPATNRLVLIAGIVSVWAISYALSLSSMWELWQTGDHHHGILVFPIVAFLVWRKRHELVAATIRPDVGGLITLIVLGAVWGISRLAGIQVIEHAAALGMIPAAVWAFLGRGFVSRLLFPLMFVLMATPVGDALVPILMVITADLSTALLKISGIPVLRDGQYIALPGGNFVVADVCSGVRYLIAGGMLSLLYGYLTYKSWTKRTILLVATALILIVTNAFRAYIVMAVASASNLQYLGGRDHIYFGWMLFGIVMMSIMWFGARYADAELVAISRAESVDQDERPVQTAMPIIVALGLIMLAITLKPLQADFGRFGVVVAVGTTLLIFLFLLNRQRSGSRGAASKLSTPVGKLALRDLLGGVLGLAVLVGTPQLIAAAEKDSANPFETISSEPRLDCRAAGVWRNLWRPIFHDPKVEYAVAFNCDEKTVNIYVAAYASASQGQELINSSNQITPPEWGRLSRHRRQVIEMPDGSSWDVAEVANTRTGNESIVWYWYEIDGARTPSAITAKARQVLAMFRRRPAGGRIVVLETSVDSDEATARARLTRAAKELSWR